MELGHSLTLSGGTHPEVSSMSPLVPSACWSVVFYYPR